jgi:hypothetical protein
MDIEIFVKAFKEGGKDGFAKKMQHASHAEVDNLVNALRLKASEADGAVSYCKMLFSNERTREMSMILCIQLLQSRSFSEKASFRCLAELRTAMMDMAISSRPCNKSRSTTVNILNRICDRLIGFLRGNQHNFSGYSQALELLPAALQCLDSLHSESRLHDRSSDNTDDMSGQDERVNMPEPASATSVRQDMLEKIFSSSWPGAMVLPLELALGDICLTDQEQLSACNKIRQHQDTVPEDHMIGLIQACLSMAEKSGQMHWLDAGRGLLERTPEHLLGDAYCIAEMSLQSGSSLMGLLLNYFSSLGLEANGGAPMSGVAQSHASNQACNGAAASSPALALTVTDVNLMLVVAQNDLFRDLVMDAMTGALGKHFSHSPSHVQARAFFARTHKSRSYTIQDHGTAFLHGQPTLLLLFLVSISMYS